MFKVQISIISIMLENDENCAGILQHSENAIVKYANNL